MNKQRCGVCVVLVIFAAAYGLGQTSAAKSAGSASLAPASAGAAGMDNRSSLAQVLIANEKALAEAHKRKDLDFFRRTMTDDFLEVAADAKVYTKDDVLMGIQEADLIDFSVYDMKVLPLNSDAAVVTYNAIVHMTVGSQQMPRYQHLSSVWVNQDGKWLLKFHQATAAQ